jgi:hypothetical protein
MHDENGAIVEVSDQVFRTTAERLHLAPPQPVLEIGRERETQIGASPFNLDNACADHGGLEAAADCFYFGQFGHQYACVLARPT